MSDFVREAAFKTMQAVVKERDQIILDAVERLTGNLPTPRECREHGSRSIDSLGNETYFWSGKPLVMFAKQSSVLYSKQDDTFSAGNNLTVTLKYQLYV